MKKILLCVEYSVFEKPIEFIDIVYEWSEKHQKNNFIYLETINNIEYYCHTSLYNGGKPSINFDEWARIVDIERGK